MRVSEAYALRDFLSVENIDGELTHETNYSYFNNPLSLCACRSTPLTPEGKKVLVLDRLSSLPSACERLDVVVAKAPSGYDQALTLVRNRAGSIPGANTIVINTVEGHTISRRISAVAFNCSTNGTPAAIAADAQPVGVSKEQFEKAKKCQSKGGVWVNNQCVVQLD